MREHLARHKVHLVWDADSGKLDPEIAHDRQQVLNEMEKEQNEVATANNDLKSKIVVKRAYFYDLVGSNFIKREPELFVIRGDEVTVTNNQNEYSY
jgi:hypothetical protein